MCGRWQQCAARAGLGSAIVRIIVSPHDDDAPPAGACCSARVMRCGWRTRSAARSPRRYAGGTPRPPRCDVGQAALAPCDSAGALVRHVERAARSERVVAGTVPVYFEFYPHSRPGPAARHAGCNRGRPRVPGHRIPRGIPGAFEPLRERLRRADHGQPRHRALRGAWTAGSCRRPPRSTEEGMGGCGRSLGATRRLYSTALGGR